MILSGKARAPRAIDLSRLGQLFAVLFVLLFAGCADNAEDRAFFNSGWVKPEAGAKERMLPEHY